MNATAGGITAVGFAIASFMPGGSERAYRYIVILWVTLLASYLLSRII